MQSLMQDLRYGWRGLRQRPGFTLIAVLTLALGIGANAAIFSLIDGILLRPLPYDAPENLVRVWQTSTRNPQSRIQASALNFRDWRRDNTVFTDMAAYFSSTAFNLTGAGDAERISGTPVSASLFSMLGRRPALGREFSADEDTPGAPHVVLLSNGMWQRRFAADPNIVGRTLTLDGEPYTIIGVMPAGFEFPSPETALWTPIAIDEANWGRGNFFFEVLARLKPGVALQAAEAEMETIARRLEAAYPETNTDSRVALIPLHEQIVGRARPLLLVLWASVGLVLLIACANVANLLLARGAARQREIAVRLALGASRLRLVRQLLTESLLLGIGGGVIGMLLAWLILPLLKALDGSDLPRLAGVGLNLRVLGFTFAAALLTGLLFGLAPALHLSRPDLNEVLKAGGRGVAGGGRWMRQGLVVAEIAIAVVVLAGAGLLVRSFGQLLEVDAGFRPEGVLTGDLALSRSEYGEATQRAAFFERVLERVAALPGVEGVGVTTALPFGRANNWRLFHVEGSAHNGPRDYTGAGYRAVSEDYFNVLGVPLLRGRALMEADRSGTEPVIVINEAFVRQYYAGVDPVGRRMKLGTEPSSPGAWMTVVGVVGDVRHTGLDAEVRPEMYQPFRQSPALAMTLAVRSSIDNVQSLTSGVRRAVASVDARQPLSRVATMEQLVSRSAAQRRLNMTLVGLFAMVAAGLAALGIYGVMSYTVAQHQREIGIRMALGAQRRDIFRLVVGQGALLAGGGLVVGAVAAWGATRWMASLLFGVTAGDPLTFGIVAVALGGLALAACLLPARRATRIAPIIALREE